MGTSHVLHVYMVACIHVICVCVCHVCGGMHMFRGLVACHERIYSHVYGMYMRWHARMK